MESLMQVKRTDNISGIREFPAMTGLLLTGSSHNRPRSGGPQQARLALPRGRI